MEIYYALLAQLVEHRTLNPQVVGSIPTGGTKHLLKEESKMNTFVRHSGDELFKKIMISLTTTYVLLIAVI